MSYRTQEPPSNAQSLPEYLSRELRRVEQAFNEIKWFTGSGSPEGRIPAAQGALYSDLSAGASPVLYVKESGVGTTGWVGK